MSSGDQATRTLEGVLSGNRPILYPPYTLRDDTTFPLRTAPLYMCELCQSMVDNWGNDWRVIAHHNTMAGLEQSALQGCGLCRQFLTAAMRHSSSLAENRPGETGFIYRTTLGSESEWNLRLIINESPGRSPGAMSVIDLIPTDQPAFEYDAIITSPSTLDGMHLCKKWLQTCVERHKICSSKNSEYKPPSRLLAIGGASILLYETKGEAKSI
ncbi:hypothetical protein ONS96_007774 [Cadophora gregata f. sp. sojae]|nr:hypothetical protein ONS96_007774 [Cadophora gregata f. sp. sojae]